MTGRLELAGAELRDFTRLINNSGSFFEIYDAVDGSVNGGWQIGGDDLQGHLWDSCKNQTWSATGYIGAVLNGIFGIRTMEDGVELKPCVPECLQGSCLKDLHIQGKTIGISLENWGSKIRSLTVNGRPHDAVIRFNEGENFDIHLIME